MSARKPAASSEKKRVEYGVRSYERADEDQVLNLMSAALGESSTLRRTADLWRWKHEESPFGESHRLIAESAAGEVIGLRAFLRCGRGDSWVIVVCNEHPGDNRQVVVQPERFVTSSCAADRPFRRTSSHTARMSGVVSCDRCPSCS